MSRADWSVSGLPVSFGRRRLLVSLGAGAAGLVAARLIPAAAAGVASGDAVAADPGARGDRTVDDVWGPYPHYSAPIGFGRPRGQTLPPEPVDPQLAV